MSLLSPPDEARIALKLLMLAIAGAVVIAAAMWVLLP
jgi:hypothetical protein